MKKLYRSFGIMVVVMLAYTSTSHANSNEQREAVRMLGQLNGIALQCKYSDEARYIKQSLIVSLPKKRDLGELFDDATHQSFIAFMEEKKDCPDKKPFNEQIDKAVEGLRSVFAIK